MTGHLPDADGQQSVCRDGHHQARSATLDKNIGTYKAPDPPAKGCRPEDASHFGNLVADWIHHRCRDESLWGCPDAQVECGWRGVTSEREQEFAKRGYATGEQRDQCKASTLATQAVKNKITELAVHDIPPFQYDAKAKWAACFAGVDKFEVFMRDRLHHSCKYRIARAHPHQDRHRGGQARGAVLGERGLHEPPRLVDVELRLAADLLPFELDLLEGVRLTQPA